jgi:hypothetical protein
MKPSSCIIGHEDDIVVDLRRLLIVAPRVRVARRRTSGVYESDVCASTARERRSPPQRGMIMIVSMPTGRGTATAARGDKRGESAVGITLHHRAPAAIRQTPSSIAVIERVDGSMGYAGIVRLSRSRGYSVRTRSPCR